MTKPQKIEGGWVEDFDKKFIEPHREILKGREGDVWAEAMVGSQIHDLEIMKDFISDLLASERQRCVEALPKFDHSKLEKDPNPTHDKDEVWCCMDCYDDGQKNEAIDQAKHNLEQLK